MFLPHVSLTIVNQDAAPPEKEVRMVYELFLNLGCKADGISHISGAFAN